MSDDGPVQAEVAELARDTDWQRLDPRMLLVHPIREVLRFLPVIFGLFIAGTASGSERPWEYLGVAIPIGLGVLRYLTTRFRITGGRVELRRGLLNTHLLSTPIDRVRTVDLTSSPIHRILGLTTVRIGTGTASTAEDEALDLDGLPLERARELREELLRRVDRPEGDASGAGGAPGAAPAERVVVRFSPVWLVNAPLTSSGVVIAAGILGAGSQLLNVLGLWDRVDSVPMVSGDQPWLLLGPVLTLLVIALVSLLAVVGYVITNWGFVLSQRAGAWHLRRGLLTTRETSIDDDRLLGVTISTPLGLRLAGGARLSAIATGLDRQQQVSSVLVPPAPAPEVSRVAAEVLGTAAPLLVPLVDHGPRARTRRFTRALVPATLLSAGALGAVLGLGAPGWWLALAVLAPPAALALAVDRWHSLGHSLVDGWLTVRSGSVDRRRSVLQTGGIIGWNLSSSWFQRRAGLTTLVATTAGGRQAYVALDLSESQAVDLTDRAVPGLVSQFLA